MTILIDSKTIGTQAPAQVEANLPLAQTSRRPRSLLFTFLRSIPIFVLLVAALFVAERLAPLQVKPSSMAGAAIGNAHTQELATSLAAQQAQAAALQEEQARMAQDVEAMKQANDRVTAAYAALFQRGTIIVQSIAQAGMNQLQMQAVTIEKAQHGQQALANGADFIGSIFSALGEPSGQALRSYAAEERSRMASEASTYFRREAGKIAYFVQNWSHGLPDPAELLAQSVGEQPLRPSARAMAPASIYQSPATVN